MVPHELAIHARFQKHRSGHSSGAAQHAKTSRSPCGRSIPQAPAGGTHKNSLRSPITSKPIKPSYSQCRRSIPQATARDAHQSHHDTSKLAIPHVDAQFREQSLPDAHQWHDSSSRPAVPHVDARFQKHPLMTCVRGSTAHQNQPLGRAPKCLTAS